MKSPLVCAVVLLWTCAFAAQPELLLKKLDFSNDPQWEGYNNHIVPAELKSVMQDFGYVAPVKNKLGAIGGRINRAAKPAFYAKKIGRASLDSPLSASGSFRLTHSTGNSGVFFGWFNASQPGGSGRPVQCLGLDFDGENSGARLAIRMINSKNKSCGTFVTPFIPGKFRPTPIRNDGTKYEWKLKYDPTATHGRGRFTFSIHGNRKEHEQFEDKEFEVELPEGFRSENASFDHFGIMNMMKAGGVMELHFSELTLDGQQVDLQTDPKWDAAGNRETYQDDEPAGTHDFGWSKETSFAGGKPGEVGGKFWRCGTFGYYADKVGQLSLSDRLEASGKVVLLVGAPDSDMQFGWFSGAATNRGTAKESDFLGVHIGGPTRIGHYFSPRYVTAQGHEGKLKSAPILTPGKVFGWRLVYDPAGAAGAGAVTATLGQETVTLPLRPGHKVEGASFDRFGFVTVTQGGQMVKVYFDDLNYTSVSK
jgi:hypothetical protein